MKEYYIACDQCSKRQVMSPDGRLDRLSSWLVITRSHNGGLLDNLPRGESTFCSELCLFRFIGRPELIAKVTGICASHVAGHELAGAESCPICEAVDHSVAGTS